MFFFRIYIKMSDSHLSLEDMHETRPLYFVAEAVRARRGLGVASFVHFGYERPVQRPSGPDVEVVYLPPSTTVGQAYHSFLQASSFELSVVYKCTHDHEHTFH